MATTCAQQRGLATWMLVVGILGILTVSPGVANAAMAADPTGQTRCVPDGDVEICTVGGGGSIGGAPIDPGTRTPPGSGSTRTGQSTPGLPGTGASPQTGESVLQQCPRGARCTYNADGQIVKCSKPDWPDVWCGPTGDPQGEALARAYRDRTDKVIAVAVAQGQNPQSALLSDAMLQQYRDGLKARMWKDYTWGAGHWEGTGWDPPARVS